MYHFELCSPQKAQKHTRLENFSNRIPFWTYQPRKAQKRIWLEIHLSQPAAASPWSSKQCWPLQSTQWLRVWIVIVCLKLTKKAIIALTIGRFQACDTHEPHSKTAIGQVARRGVHFCFHTSSLKVVSFSTSNFWMGPLTATQNAISSKTAINCTVRLFCTAS